MNTVLLIGRQGQQSEKIADPLVSRQHLTMFFSGNPQKPYRIKTCRENQSLYVNGVSLCQCDIDGNEQILLGSGKYKLDIKSAIEDLLFLRHSQLQKIIYRTLLGILFVVILLLWSLRWMSHLTSIAALVAIGLLWILCQDYLKQSRK